MRYWDIAQSLREEIGSGRHAVGDRLPTEEQLMQAYGASRHAIREALRLLIEDGLISRRPRAGSTVIGLAPQVQFSQRVSSMQELINYPPNTERRELSASYVVADHEIAAVLRCAVGTTWYRFETMRYAAGSALPLCHTHVYVRPEYAAIARHRKHDQIPFADQIAEMYGVHAESTAFEISASLVSQPSATLLNVAEGSPALTTIRRYADAEGRTFEVSIAVHPAQRYSFNFQLRRERPAGRF